MTSAIRSFNTCIVGVCTLLLTGGSSCKQLDSVPPSTAVEGSYQAKYINLTGSTIVGYPINGQTLSLQIRSVAPDTVQVNIQAPPNDKYSPGQNLSYPKAYIVSRISANSKITYYISLTNAADPCGYNSLQIYSTGELDYYFVPPGNQSCIRSRVRFAK